MFICNYGVISLALLGVLLGAGVPGFGQAVSPEAKTQRSVEVSDALKSEDKHWRDLDAPRRGIKDRVAALLELTPALTDQQAAAAIYLLAVGRPPTDEEIKQAIEQHVEAHSQPLGVLQIARGLVQGKQFNADVAAANVRLLKLKADLAAAREKAGLLNGDEVQMVAADCAKSVDKAIKSEQQATDLAFLLVLSRFPTEAETTQIVAHLKKAPDRATALKDTLWYLLNTKEFIVGQ
jgi:hypothetical protein